MELEQSEADRLAGTLRLRFAGGEKLVPALRLGAGRRWIEALVETMTAVAATSTEGPDGLLRLASATTDGAVDALLAYDTTNVLGGREWLDGNAEAFEIRDALDTMRARAIPFGEAAGLTQLILTAAQLAAQSYTNGRSPSGDSPRTSSKRRSRRTS